MELKVIRNRRLTTLFSDKKLPQIYGYIIRRTKGDYTQDNKASLKKEMDEEMNVKIRSDEQKDNKDEWEDQKR